MDHEAGSLDRGPVYPPRPRRAAACGSPLRIRPQIDLPGPHSAHDSPGPVGIRHEGRLRPHPSCGGCGGQILRKNEVSGEGVFEARKVTTISRSFFRPFRSPAPPERISISIPLPSPQARMRLRRRWRFAPRRRRSCRIPGRDGRKAVRGGRSIDSAGAAAVVVEGGSAKSASCGGIPRCGSRSEAKSPSVVGMLGKIGLDLAPRRRDVSRHEGPGRALPDRRRWEHRGRGARAPQHIT